MLPFLIHSIHSTALSRLKYRNSCGYLYIFNLTREIPPGHTEIWHILIIICQMVNWTLEG